MKKSLIALFVCLSATLATAHPGHGEDPVHYVTGLDWPVALLLIVLGSATAYFARNTLVRVLGGLAACGGLIFATTLV